MKILFLFNQLLDDKLSSGGDVKSHTILTFMMMEKSFDVSISAPTSGHAIFPKKPAFSPLPAKLEKVFPARNHPSLIFPLYLLRAWFSAFNLVDKDFDAIYSSGDFICNALPAFFYKVIHPKIIWCQCIYHINKSPLYRNNSFARGNISYLLQQFSFFLIKKKADVIFVLNENVKQELRLKGFENKIIVSRAGIDPDKISNYVEELGRIEKKNQLCFFGRVNPTKGIYDLPGILELIQERRPGIKLHIIGGIDQETENNLKQRFQQKGILGDVTIHGYVKDHNKLYRILAESKALLAPSYEEGWGIVVFEAIFTGTIPVVYDLPIYKEIYNGLVPTARIGEIGDFAKTTISVIESGNYQEILSNLKSIAKEYTWEKVYEVELNAIQKVNKII